mmetsp:Transcript_24667/g.44879  ORF Transcript_24667/g.44879 Transcript_24667/m.44879 type:complete len:417 (-) Transcript_24667:28-1278(-)
MPRKEKPHGRLPTSSAPISTTAVDDRSVRFTADNGETYHVDIVQMYQRNLRSGKRRAVMRSQGQWFFDGALLRKGASEKFDHNPKWAVYSKEMQVLLELVFNECQIGSKNKSTFNESMLNECRAELKKKAGQKHAEILQHASYSLEQYDPRTAKSLMKSLKKKYEAKAVLQESKLDVENSQGNPSLRCPLHHPLGLVSRWNHSCNLCEAQGTVYRCLQGCDYDICKECFQRMHMEHDESSAALSAEHFLALAQQASPGHLPLQDALVACDALLAPGVKPSVVLPALSALVRHQGLQFSVEDARRAALHVGSRAVLQLVLCSAPQVQVVGVDIFDRRYPGLVLDESRKECIKILFARGAQLGKVAPPGKLLRKVEGDMLEAWVWRYLDSAARAGIDFPDVVQQHVLEFISCKSIKCM